MFCFLTQSPNDNNAHVTYCSLLAVGFTMFSNFDLTLLEGWLVRGSCDLLAIWLLLIRT